MSTQGKATQAAGQTKETAKQAGESTPVRFLARLGLGAHGVVHLLIAYLALKVALSGGGGGKADKSGALATVGEQPGGRILLGAIAVAFAALVVWQAWAAVWGHRRFEGTKRTGKRIVSGARAVIFGVLAANAAKLAIGGSSGSDSEKRTFTARALDMPGGQFLVGAVGVAVVVVSAYLAYHGISKRFTEDLDLSRAKPAARKATVRFGQFGYPGVAAAYGIVGVLIVLGAVTYAPEKATGLDAALKTLVEQPYGPWLLGLVALGLAGFGVYRLFDARYHRP